jgi:hypothetical protein
MKLWMHKSATISGEIAESRNLKAVNKVAPIEEDPCPSPRTLPSWQNDEILACRIP